MKKRVFFVIIYSIFILSVAPCFTFSESRGLWVTRFDFKTEADIVQIMENARFLGANQVYFQVRGNATVFYPSKFEPWAWELNDGTPKTIGVDPGWNPLQTALDEAEKQGLELHAWMNVFPGWRGVIPGPKGSKQPWVAHRSWFMIDHRGVLLRPSRSFYSFMSPGHPEVRAHLAKVFGEVASLYPNLKGLHMDYVRYPGRTEIRGFRDFSYDRESVSAFKKQYKKKPHYSQPEWQRFKCEQVNASISAIRKAIHDASPTMKLSGTCFANIHSATEEKGQDPRDWVNNNLVDWVVPMVYERNERSFVGRLDEWNPFFEEKQLNQMVIGINVDFNKENEIVRQLKSVEDSPYGGVILFAYSSMFPNHKGNRKADVVRSIWQEQHLQELLKNKILLPSQ